MQEQQPGAPGPGARYAHVMVVIRNFLVIFGGKSSGQARSIRYLPAFLALLPQHAARPSLTSSCLYRLSQILSDTWALDLDSMNGPYARWERINPAGSAPGPLAYASATTRSDGLVAYVSGGYNSASAEPRARTTPGPALVSRCPQLATHAESHRPCLGSLRHGKNGLRLRCHHVV